MLTQKMRFQINALESPLLHFGGLSNPKFAEVPPCSESCVAWVM